MTKRIDITRLTHKLNDAGIAEERAADLAEGITNSFQTVVEDSTGGTIKV